MQNFENLEAIIFDLGNVIVKLDTNRTEEAFNALGAKSFATVFQIHQQSEFLNQYEIGKISDADFRREMQAALQFSIDDNSFDHAFTAMLLDIDPAHLTYLQHLRQHYKVFVFSNTNAIHMRTYWQQQKMRDPNNDLESYFDRVYFSYEMGTRKPETAGFLQIIQENKLNADKTLFVDDIQKNVEGARAAGLLAYHFTVGASLYDLPIALPLEEKINA